ncbi:prolipoprotein diacylglyceryl transferase [Cellulomonas hominis]|uniref:prolipoprotein diacylglyceryl transferase family protein n=1 Tax=Cellulomonas hominis TaxID=156981 RepID=UPI001C0FB747|nr:prolipoprotein diacylglyceryl transferase family protein [Cellulomonas hominis]MBU5421127.1 prolipoprotein diacylglyceryl transferase [Cellulomonas hominis]
MIDTPRLAQLSGTANPGPTLQFVASPLRAVADVEPQAVGVTYWFDLPVGPEPHHVALRFTGRRLDVVGDPSDADHFQVVTRIPDVRTEQGPVAVTQRVTGKGAGRWRVRVDAVATPRGGDTPTVVRLPTVEEVGHSAYAPATLSLAPGVVPWSWPAMVGLGFVLGVAILGALAPMHGLAPLRVLLFALAAGALGLFGAKVYYWLTHPRESRVNGLAGLSLQGFIVTAVAVFAVAGWTSGVHVGHLLDASIPALLLGQAVGRVGCFFAGCCAGVPTASRWGLWSSDRRIGIRRVPVQLLESSSAALLALVTGLIAALAPPGSSGFLFLGGLAAYVLTRQILFPLRGLPRLTKHGRTVMLIVAPAALVVSAAVLSVA